jgi:hypothetical protein
VTAATLRAQRTMLAGRGRCGGDAQERAATNPVAALSCAYTPLLHPLFVPLLQPLLAPQQRPWGWPHPLWRLSSRSWCPTPAGRARGLRATGRGLWGS